MPFEDLVPRSAFELVVSYKGSILSLNMKLSIEVRA